MIHLLKKAKWIFLAMLTIYILSFGAGFISGKLNITTWNRLGNSKVFKFNRNLEYHVPLYGDLLQSYRDWYRKIRTRVLFERDYTKTRLLIFMNNFVFANITMALRAALVFPMIFYPMGRFFQGVLMSEGTMIQQFWILIVLEFGGYFITICATLCLIFWILFYRRFGFSSRKKALINGVKFFGIMYLISGIAIAIGSYLEVSLIMKMLGGS